MCAWDASCNSKETGEYGGVSFDGILIPRPKFPNLDLTQPAWPGWPRWPRMVGLRPARTAYNEGPI